MNQYKIVCLKEKAKQISDVYPHFIELLYQKQDNLYDTKQVELLFENISSGKEKLLKIIQKRDDYSYFHGVHQIMNTITDDKITIIMNEYDIEVEENSNKHVIFDIMKGFSENFYMIKA